MQKHKIIKIWLLSIAAIWLSFAICSHWEYGTYTLMRLFVAYSAIQLAIWHPKHTIPFLIIAVIYQPIFKLHFNRDIWSFINAITALGSAVLGIWEIKDMIRLRRIDNQENK
ncbi:MAG: DUF6804 family protein [Lentisphaeria bacterium]|jgi:hypothetical protein